MTFEINRGKVCVFMLFLLQQTVYKFTDTTAYGWFIFGVQIADYLEVAIRSGVERGKGRDERGAAIIREPAQPLTITFYEITNHCVCLSKFEPVFHVLTVSRRDCTTFTALLHHLCTHKEYLNNIP